MRHMMETSSISMNANSFIEAPKLIIKFKAKKVKNEE